MKLKHIVESFIDDKVEIDEDGFLESVSNYNSYGKNIYREGNLAETANTLAEIAKSATIHAVRETGDSFDKITGFPILLNTSMNLPGYPITGSFEVTKKMFDNSQCDALILGNNIFTK